MHSQLFSEVQLSTGRAPSYTTGKSWRSLQHCAHSWALLPIYLTAGVEPVIAERFFIMDSEAVSSSWDQGYLLTGSNKAIFLLQPQPGRSALDADQQFTFTWVTWNKPDSFKAKWKSVPSMSRGRPQRSACSS